MTEELTTCDLTCPSSPSVTEGTSFKKLSGMDGEQPIFSVLKGEAGVDSDASTSPYGGATTSTDTESGIFSGEGEMCVEHESELDWFCGTEQKLICSHCAIVGSCHGHTVTPLAARVTAVRNQLVDVCEKIQLQALRIEKFIDQTLTAKEQKLQQNTLEKEERYERQQEELKPQPTVQISLNLELSTELKALKEADVPEEKPCEQESIATASAPELLEVTKAPEEKACEQESIATASAPELLDVTEVSEETHPGKPKKSSWKRARHFLGLRKPQKWKKKDGFNNSSCHNRYQTSTPRTSLLLTATASSAREQILAQVSAAREALEEEEQRLLEQVHREEERVEQCLLTQRAHWSQALASLSQTRSGLVHMLTHTPDPQLAASVQEISERVEEAEGVGEPCDTDKLNLNPGCSDSKLLRGLWAAAVLLGPNAYGSSYLKFDERTVSPLLSLSDDFCTLTFLHKKPRQSPPYDPARFDCWPNALGSVSLSSGTHSWVMDVGQSAAFKVGVCYASLERKGSGNEARLGNNSQSWVLSHYDGDYSFCHAGKNVPLQLVRRPQRIGLLLDWPSQTLMFYEPDSSAVLYSVTQRFKAPLVPACAVTDRTITILH